MSSPEPSTPPDRRKLLWWAFWLVFLTTPVCVLFAPALASKIHFVRGSGVMGLNAILACLGSLIGGAGAAGFILARLTSKTNSDFISRGIAYSMGIAALYLILAFAGCLVVVVARA
jgi:hypothetical protein